MNNNWKIADSCRVRGQKSGILISPPFQLAGLESKRVKQEINMDKKHIFGRNNKLK